MPGYREHLCEQSQKGAGEPVGALGIELWLLNLEMHCDSRPLDCNVHEGNLGNHGNRTELGRLLANMDHFEVCGLLATLLALLRLNLRRCGSCPQMDERTL